MADYDKHDKTENLFGDLYFCWYSESPKKH